MLDGFVEHCFSSDYEKWDSSDLSEKETENWRFDRAHFPQGLNPAASDHEHDATSDANNEDALNLIMRHKEKASTMFFFQKMNAVISIKRISKKLTITHIIRDMLWLRDSFLNFWRWK